MYNSVIEKIIEEEYQRILREIHGMTLYGIPVDPSNVKQLVVAVDLRNYARGFRYRTLTEIERQRLYLGTFTDEEGGD